MSTNGEIVEIKKLVTPDMVEHPTMEAARYWNARNKIVGMIHRVDPEVIDLDLAGSIASVMGQNPDVIDEWIKAVDAINRTLKLRPLSDKVDENP